MSNWLIRRDQPIVKKKMYYFKMEFVSMEMPPVLTDVIMGTI